LFRNLYNRARQGLIEVWLPSLPEPSLNIKRPLPNSDNEQRPRRQPQLQMPYSKK
jgi:hypothetical protein